MWAGSRLNFHAPIAFGEEIVRRSTILSIKPKSGQYGEMVFVTVEHAVSAAELLAITEQRDIVYRAPPEPGAAAPSPRFVLQPDSECSRTVAPDPRLLFRYSALTYNSHRIHYDRNYATEVGGYSGLVVHWPLIGTLLLNHRFRRYRDARVTSFSFRAQSPLFDNGSFNLKGA